MKKHLLVLLFLLFTMTTTAQRLSELPRLERDSILMARLKEVVSTRFSSLYRENVRPSLEKGDFRWVALKNNGWVKSNLRFLPNYIREDDEYYRLVLYDDHWRDNRNWSTFSVAGVFLDRTGELLQLENGVAGLIYSKDDIDSYKSEERLSLMPKEKRDSILLKTSLDALKKYVPQFKLNYDAISVKERDGVEKAVWSDSYFWKCFPQIDSPYEKYYEVAFYKDSVETSLYSMRGSECLVYIREKDGMPCFATVFIRMKSGGAALGFSLYSLEWIDSELRRYGSVYEEYVKWLKRGKEIIEKNNRSYSGDSMEAYQIE